MSMERVKGLADLARRAGKVDHHKVGKDVFDGETERLKPVCDCVEIFLGRTILLALFCRHDPLVEIG